MKHVSLARSLAVGLLFFALAGCGNNAPINPPPTPAPTPTPTPTPTPPPPPGPIPGPVPTPTPGGESVSGTLTSSTGGDLLGTAVVVCAPDFSACDYGTAIETSGTSASYTVPDVPSGEYAVAALQDTNGDGEFAGSDLFGVFTTDGTNPATVSPPATGVDITLTPLEGQPDPGPAPDAGTISGTVTASGGEDLLGTAVLACTLDFSACDYGVAIEASGTSASYTVVDVPSGEYTVVAFQDTNGDEELGEGDLFGVYTTDGTNPAPVSPPATGVDITMSTLSAASTDLLQRDAEGTKRAAVRQKVLDTLATYLR